MVLATECKLYYSADFSEASPILIEASEDLVNEVSKGKVYIKSCPKGIVFLCSNENTYQIRRADNSNTLLFVSRSGDEQACVESSSDGIVQVEKLWLDEIPDGDFAPLFELKLPDPLANLNYSTIWSESQILKHLRGSDNYFLSDGSWKKISDEQFYCDLDSLLNLCAITGGGRDFNTEELWIQMNEFNESENRIGVSLHYVQYLLSRLTVGEAFLNKGETEWPLVLQLDEEKVIIHRGRQVIHQVMSENQRQLKVSTFIAEWRSILETSVGVDVFTIEESNLVAKYLQQAISGRASLDEDVLTWLDSRTLSIHAEERIQQLFRVRQKWKKIEFESYITPLLQPGIKPESVLLKSCRLDEETDGIWYYTSKF